MTDLVWQALIAGAVTIILAWMNQRTRTAVVSVGAETKEAVKVAGAEAVSAAVDAKQAAVVTVDKAVLTNKKLDKVLVVSTETKDLVQDVVNVTTQAVAISQSNDTTNKKIDDLLLVGKETLHHVNSALGVQLKLNAELSEWKANQTKLPKDIEASETAQKMLTEHNKKQAKIDAGPDAQATKDIMKGTNEE